MTASKGTKLKVMLVDEDPDRAADVRAALVACGCEVISLLASPLEIYDAVKTSSPDVIIIDTESPSRDSLENLAFVSRDQPHPIVMFSGDRSSETIREAIRAGVSAYVVDGLSEERLQPILQVAVARFAAEQSLKQELADAKTQLADRKDLERAKGILMKQRELSEEEAFQMLRKFAMDRGIKMADAAARVIEMESMLGKVDTRYPLALTTGRLRDQWHGMSRTGNVARLFGHAPEPRLTVNPNDLSRRGLKNGELVKIESRRGTIYSLVEASDTVRSGQVYLPMHWGKRFLGGMDSAGVNTLTVSAFDPHSRQPELKHAAVKVSAAELSWHLTAFAARDGDENALLDALQPLQSEVAFFSTVLIGRDRPGVLVRAAHHGAPSISWLDTLDRLLGLENEMALRYEDTRRASSRRMLIEDDVVRAVRLCGEPGAIESGEWLREWLLAERPVAEIRRLLLSPATHAPSGFVLAGRVVCQCFNVTEDTIISALGEIAGEPKARCTAVQEQLKCGSNCGSCLPELRQLVAHVVPSETQAAA